MGRRCEVMVALLGACLLLVIAKGVWAVQITALRVPAAVRNGSASALLDCEYSLRTDDLRDDAGLVVKWYFNNSPSPVYQWIPGGRPQDLGILRGRLDLSHRVSDHKSTMYRALYVVRPTTELSGEYKCHVSTFEDEDFMTKKMVVFAVGEELQMWGSPQGEALNVSCRGSGFFPEPKVELFVDGTPLDKVSVVSTENDGAFDVTASALLPPRGPVGSQGEGAEGSGVEGTPDPTSDHDSDPGPALVACHLKIPGTDFALRKSFVYYKGERIPTNDSGAGPPGRALRAPLLLGALFLHLLFLLLLSPRPRATLRAAPASAAPASAAPASAAPAAPESAAVACC